MRVVADRSDAALYRAVVLGLTWIAGIAGHAGGDFLLQPDPDALHKQDHTRPTVPHSPEDTRTPCQRVRDGHKALTRHCVSYGLTQAAVKAAAYKVAGVRVPWYAQAAGALTEMVLHGVIDDGRLLRAFAYRIGKGKFHDLADAGVNGRMLLDQAAHAFVQQQLGAFVTTLLAGRGDRR